MTLLSVESLSVTYGAIRAVRDLTFLVDTGEIVAVLGANGAGKSTTLNAIMGLLPGTAGRVSLDGKEIQGHPPERIVRHGITLTPEGRHVFPRLTVEENLRVGSIALGDRSQVDALYRQMYDRFPVLSQRRAQAAGTLSGGEQQQLAIARSLMSDPRLLMLDEPSLGLAPQFVDAIFDLIVELRDQGKTILLVEQNVEQTLAIADRAYVLAGGELKMEGSAEQLRASSDIERTYLGIGAD